MSGAPTITLEQVECNIVVVVDLNGTSITNQDIQNYLNFSSQLRFEYVCTYSGSGQPFYYYFGNIPNGYVDNSRILRFTLNYVDPTIKFYNTTYSFKVRICNNNNNCGPYSNDASITYNDRICIDLIKSELRKTYSDLLDRITAMKLAACAERSINREELDSINHEITNTIGELMNNKGNFKVFLMVIADILKIRSGYLGEDDRGVYQIFEDDLMNNCDADLPNNLITLSPAPKLGGRRRKTRKTKKSRKVKKSRKGRKSRK